MANTNTQTTNCPKCGRLNLPEGHADCPGVNRSTVSTERKGDLTRAALAGVSGDETVDRGVAHVQEGLEVLQRAAENNSWTKAERQNVLDKTGELASHMEHLQQIITNSIAEEEKTAAPASAKAEPAKTKLPLKDRVGNWLTSSSSPRQKTPRDLYEEKVVSGQISGADFWKHHV